MFFAKKQVALFFAILLSIQAQKTNWSLIYKLWNYLQNYFWSSSSAILYYMLFYNPSENLV
jgi:hypothetical protein